MILDITFVDLFRSLAHQDLAHENCLVEHGRQNDLVEWRLVEGIKVRHI